MSTATETVSWVAVTTSDDGLGNETTTEASPVSMLAFVAARSADESHDSRTPSVIVGKTLYLPSSAVEPSASDWFTIRGERYEVDGEAHRWGSAGVEVAVKRAEARP